MLATLVKVGHALRVSLALHGPTLLQLSHEIDKPLRFAPSHCYCIIIQKHIQEWQLLMADSLNMGCPDKKHWTDSEDTGQ